MLEHQDPGDLDALGFPPAPKIRWEACEGISPSMETSSSRPSVTWSASGGSDSGNSGSPTSDSGSGAPENWNASSPSPTPSTSTPPPLTTTTSPSTNAPRPTSPVEPTEKLGEVAAGLAMGYPVTIGVVVVLIIISGLVTTVIWYVRF